MIHAGNGHRHRPAATSPWSKPVQLATPAAADLQQPTIAISPRGDVAVAYGATNEDAPQNAYAALVAGSGGTMPVTTTKAKATKIKTTKAKAVTRRGHLGTRFAPPELVPSAEQVLALGNLGGQPELLTGDGNGGALTGDTATGVACCTEAGAQAGVSAGLFTALQPLTAGMDGGSSGALVPEAHGALAVIAGANGIWTAYGSNRHGFTQPQATQLAKFSGPAPALAAGTLSGGRALVAWTQPRAAVNVATKPQSIYYAVAPAGQPAGPPRLALTVPAGFSVGQVAVARHQGVASIAWLEGWLDRRGRYHARVYAADLRGGRAVATQAVSPAGVQATQLTFAGGGDRPEVLAWQACKPGAVSCSAQAALRPHGFGWGPAATLGPLDPGEAPQTAMTTDGTALVGWVQNGRVKLTSATYGTTKFAKARKLAGKHNAAATQLTLAAGPLGTAAAAWTDGLVRQSLHAAFYAPALS